ncbi:MAG: LPS export ABC transporter periplasmic protein LptC [Candidatus Omnitrophica bacterium]|nr:LPS export ABC transporter periplasmic protein LptC [Candidatus Omnitrophota bacterium]
MMFKKIILVSGFISFALTAYAAVEEPVMQSDQQISEFNLSGYGDKGKKSWDLAGKTADIFTDTVKLKDVTGNMYGEQEDIKLTAQKGDFDKAQGKVHLQDDVVITTTGGTKLTTDSLDWDRKGQLVSTKDAVNIQRENMVIDAKGAIGHPNLKQVALQKDVKLDILPTKEEGAGGVKEKIVITCDGPLQIDYEKNIATFLNNVLVDRTDSKIYSDKMDVYFIPSKNKETGPKEDKPADKAVPSGVMGSKIDKIIASGNVKVVRGENTSFSQEAIYTAADKKLILTGRPQLVIYSQEGLSFDASAGN